MDSYEKHIQAHYAGKSLSDRKIAAILTEGEQIYRRGVARYVPIFATAAVLIIGFLFLNRYLESSRLNQQVLAEIAMNHNKQLDVEVATSRYDILQAELDRLDFVLRPADPDLREAYTLIGGRYCSIQGELAAQLKLRHREKGNVLTLYVTRLTEPLKRIEPQTTTHNDISIRLWRAGGRFFGLAGIGE